MNWNEPEGENGTYTMDGVEPELLLCDSVGWCFMSHMVSARMRCAHAQQIARQPRADAQQPAGSAPPCFPVCVSRCTLKEAVDEMAWAHAHAAARARTCARKRSALSSPSRPWLAHVRTCTAT